MALWPLPWWPSQVQWGELWLPVHLSGRELTFLEAVFLAVCNIQEGAIWTGRGSRPVPLLSLCKVISVWYRSSSFRCREHFSRLLIFRKLELNFVFLATSFLSSTAGMLHGYKDCELHARVVSVTPGYTTGYFMRTCLAGGGNKVLMERLSFSSLNKFLWDRISKPSW